MKMWKCGNVKVTRFNIQFGISCWLLATMATFAYCDEVAMFTASVWRGETAYVEIPQALQDKAVALSALRAGVVAAEKMRILCEQEGERGKKAAETVKRLAAPYGFRAAVRGFRSADPCKLDFAAFRRGVEEFVNSEH